MKHLKFILIASIVLFAFSCAKESQIVNEGNGTGSKFPKEKRTVLVYVAADNNLFSTANISIDQMIHAAKVDHYLDNGNLIIFKDRKYDEGPVLLEIKDKNGVIYADTLQKYEDLNSADAKVLSQVIQTTLKEYKADSYGLVFWSHGYSWLPKGYTSMLRSFGDDNGEVMEIPDLADAIPDDTFDFIIFDACLMSSIEVAYELRYKTNYLIASPGEILSTSFPYDRIMKYLYQDREDMQASMIGVCQEFYNYYANNDGIKSGAITLMDMDYIDNVIVATRAILQDRESVIAEMPVKDIQPMDNRTGSPKHLLYDFGDFMQEVSDDSQYARFRNSMDKFVVYTKTTPTVYYMGGTMTIDADKYCGISSYIPRTNYPTLNQWYREYMGWYNVVYK